MAALTGHTDIVFGICFSNDSEHVFSASKDKYVKQWNVKDLKLVKTFEGHEGSVKCLAIASDDKFLFSGSRDNFIIQWNVDDATIRQRFVHDSNILCVALSPNN